MPGLPIPAAVQSREEAARLFAEAAPMLGPCPLILAHFDADGLAAAAILQRAMAKAGVQADVRIVGKAENPWSDALRAELARRRPSGLVVADLGVRDGDLLTGAFTVILDHHVPAGAPENALVVSGHGRVPEPPTALLAWWCASGIADVDDLLWLAALGIVGDMADEAAFPEMAEAQRRYGKTALRSAAALVNAPRRTALADAAPALALLLKSSSPKELLSGGHPETTVLLAAREEVRSALDQARRVPPKVRGDIALIAFDSPCQIHPLVAQQWRSRLAGSVVIAANRGYRPGWVHFAARSATGRDLVEFLRARRPEGAGEGYGGGHRQATGGALPIPQWNAFVSGLGFPEERL